MAFIASPVFCQPVEGFAGQPSPGGDEQHGRVPVDRMTHAMGTQMFRGMAHLFPLVILVNHVRRLAIRASHDGDPFAAKDHCLPSASGVHGSTGWTPTQAGGLNATCRTGYRHAACLEMERFRLTYCHASGWSERTEGVDDHPSHRGWFPRRKAADIARLIDRADSWRASPQAPYR